MGAAGRVYITSRSGTTVVVDAARPDKVLARNVLDDTFGASAALVGNELYLRGESATYIAWPCRNRNGSAEAAGRRADEGPGQGDAWAALTRT